MLLSSYNCPCDNKNDCKSYVRLECESGTPCYGQFYSFADFTIYDGWVYDVKVESDRSCESFRVSSSQNLNKCISDAVSLLVPPNKSFSVTLKVISPCGLYATGKKNWVQYIYTGTGPSCGQAVYMYNGSYQGSGQSNC